MKADIYQQVTDRIIQQLEQGTVPWKSPYFSKVGFPRNFSTGKAYQGINIFLLGSLRYTSPFFLTFIQAKELGGHVRKGEQGSLVVKYGTYTKHDDGQPVTDEEEQTRRFLKGYTVFHASQIEGIEFPKPENLPELTLSEQTDRARAIVAGMPSPPAIREGSAVPCYRRNSDSVHMPEQGYFESEEAYYSTLFHELAHSTGHESRLNRKTLVETDGFGGKVYSQEELVAEMGAAYLAMEADIVADDHAQSAAYILSWLDVLREPDHKRWLVIAATQAAKAADFVLGIKQPEYQEDKA